MKFTIFLVFILASTVFVAQDEIPWSSENQLSWQDFERRVGQGGFFKANTYSGIRYTVDSEDGMIEIKIECYFLTKDSWVYREHMSDKLLNHEQGHFDITEIYARKLREALSEYEVTVESFFHHNYMKQVKRTYNNLYSEMEQKQKDYDRQTSHSLDKQEQAEWKEWIASELQSMDKWKSN